MESVSRGNLEKSSASDQKLSEESITIPLAEYNALKAAAAQLADAKSVVRLIDRVMEDGADMVRAGGDREISGEREDMLYNILTAVVLK